MYSLLFLTLQIFGSKLLSFIEYSLFADNMTFWIYGVLFAAVICMFFKNTFIISFKKIDKSGFNSLAIIGFITLVSIIICAILIDRLGIQNSNESGIDSSLNSSTLNYILTAIAAIVFAPLTEEIFFRFIVFRSINKFNMFLAHICVAILFGFFHVWVYVLVFGEYDQLIAMVPYICMSLGFSILYQKTKNISFPIILHAAINLVAVLG